MRPFLHPLAWMALIAVLGFSCARAVPTLSQSIETGEARVGDQINLSFTVQNGSLENLALPVVDGLSIMGPSTESNMSIINGAMSTSVTMTFTVTPTHAGNFVIPAFDIPSGGQVLHTRPMNLHVVENGPVTSVPRSIRPPATASPGGFPFGNPSPNPAPSAPDTPATPPAGGSDTVNVPQDSNGQASKVFIVITPKTTDAYVGESIPLKIEFYIDREVDAPQDSLPTIKGSDFLMNALSMRYQQDEVGLGDQAYHRETWFTAIDAPKAGDFPLQMERDTYWTKASNATQTDPFGNLFLLRPRLMHGSISSNNFTIHVHPLPEEGRPANFSGAIGQFKVTAEVSPQTTGVGEPINIRYIINGQGNFDYVKAPVLAPDPNWKAYVPESKTEYQDEAHVTATKIFNQAVIPQKGGILTLPSASFSYFDPTQKQYVTTPIPLPSITVTGSATPPPPAIPSTAGSAPDVPAPAEPGTNNLAANRASLGHLHPTLREGGSRIGFWMLQLVVGLILAAGVVALVFRRSPSAEKVRAERLRQEKNVRHYEAAMHEAVKRDDAPAFFMAARHAIQWQLSHRWKITPEAITLAEIRERDPGLAEALSPLFAVVDEIIYSGRASDHLPLAECETRVRQTLSELKTSSS